MTWNDDPAGTRWIRGRLSRVRATRRYKQLVEVIRREVDDSTKRRALQAILLVEMSARSRVHRGAEWAAAWATNGRMGKTRGPFQLSDAPFVFRDAVKRAEERLGGADLTPANLAVLWNGRAERQPGSRVAYATALAEAFDLVGGTRTRRFDRPA